MSNEEVSKVDLSLDEIIKMDRKTKKYQDRGRRGNSRGNNRSQKHFQNRGQGGGHRNKLARGGGGTSPVNRKKTNAEMRGSSNQGYTKDQRGAMRGWSSTRRGSRRGGSGGSRSGSISLSPGFNSSSSISRSSSRSRGRGSRGRGNAREEPHPALELASQAGFELQDIENKLATASERMKTTYLLSESRNMELTKVVLDRRYDRDRLICASDDILMLYDCRRQSMVDWFIRKEGRDTLSHFEEDTQKCVTAWPPANHVRFQPICHLVTINVTILVAAIRHVLGMRSLLRGGMRGRGTRPYQGSRGASQGSSGGHGHTQQGQGHRGQGHRNQGQGHRNQGQGHRNKSQGYQQNQDQVYQQNQDQSYQQSPGHQSPTGRLTLSQKRQMAMQALQQARKTVAQLDQQSRRQNFVNARRGISPQQVKGGSPLAGKKNLTQYSSSGSLASTSSGASSRQLSGTRVTAYNSPTPERSTSTRGRRKWRRESPALDLSGSSTLTISIDNRASSPYANTGGYSNNPSFSPDFSAPNSGTTVPKQRHRKRQQQVRRQNSGSSPESDMKRGASTNFSHQLAKLKPTVSTKYVFQKKAFAAGNSSSSLSDRFSDQGSTDLLGRKVYM